MGAQNFNFTVIYPNVTFSPKFFIFWMKIFRPKKIFRHFPTVQN